VSSDRENLAWHLPGSEEAAEKEGGIKDKGTELI
jgi:hypothetical protein